MPDSLATRLREVHAQTTTFPHSAGTFFETAAEELERLHALIDSAVRRLLQAVMEGDWLAVETLCEELERGLNNAPSETGDAG